MLQNMASFNAIIRGIKIKNFSNVIGEEDVLKGHELPLIANPILIHFQTLQKRDFNQISFT